MAKAIEEPDLEKNFRSLNSEGDWSAMARIRPLSMIGSDRWCGAGEAQSDLQLKKLGPEIPLF